MSFRKFRWLTGFALAALLLSSCNIGATPPPSQDTGAIQTQAFGQVLTQVAEQATQTAAAIPPTPMPTFTVAPTNTLPAIPPTNAFGIPTNTPFTFNTQQPGLTPQTGILIATATVGAYSTITTSNGCNRSEFMSESDPMDGTEILVGKEFFKSWNLMNLGSCIWDEGYIFAFVPEFSTGPRPGKDYVIPREGPFTKPGETRSFTVTLKAPKPPGEYIWAFKMKDDAGSYFGSMVFVKIVSVTD
jgi:hypothetical protein